MASEAFGASAFPLTRPLPSSIKGARHHRPLPVRVHQLIKTHHEGPGECDFKCWPVEDLEVEHANDKKSVTKSECAGLE